MKTIFLGLMSLCLLMLAATFGTAYAPAGWKFAGFGQTTWHMLLGLFTALVLLALHGFVILNYFIATGKAVDQALEGHESHAGFKKRTRKLKGRTFPFATMSALFIIAAAVLGGLALRHGGHPAHWIMAWLALALNLFSFKMELKSINMNMQLLDEVRPLVPIVARERRRKVREGKAAPGSPKLSAQAGTKEGKAAAEA